MASFSPRKNLDALIKRLGSMNSGLAGKVEIEELILYPHVRDRVQKYGLKYCSAYTPEGVPPEQI